MFKKIFLHLFKGPILFFLKEIPRVNSLSLINKILSEIPSDWKYLNSILNSTPKKHIVQAKTLPDEDNYSRWEIEGEIAFTLKLNWTFSSTE